MVFVAVFSSQLRAQKRVSTMAARAQLIEDGSSLYEYFSRWIAVFVCMAIHPAFAQSAAPPVAPPNWPVTSAPARFVINPESKTPPTRLSQVKLCSPDLTWLTMPIRVFNDQGVAVGSDLLWTAPGEPATLLFDSSSGSGQYKIYVGSNWPPLHLADAKAGVWLETHTGDGKIIGNLRTCSRLGKEAAPFSAARWSGGIDEGGNRFGPQDNLLIHMQGWFDVAAPEHLDLTDDLLLLVVRPRRWQGGGRMARPP